MSWSRQNEKRAWHLVSTLYRHKYTHQKEAGLARWLFIEGWLELAIFSRNLGAQNWGRGRLCHYFSLYNESNKRVKHNLNNKKKANLVLIKISKYTNIFPVSYKNFSISSRALKTSRNRIYYRRKVSFYKHVMRAVQIMLESRTDCRFKRRTNANARIKCTGLQRTSFITHNSQGGDAVGRQCAAAVVTSGTPACPR